MVTERSPLIPPQTKSDGPIEGPEQRKTKRNAERSNEANRKLSTAILFALAFMIVELIGGFMANSLAIMTDAAHLLSDVAGFLISLIAIWFGRMDATSRLSYGFHRAEVIGAILSVMLIWVLTGILLYEAVFRIIDLTSPDSTTRTDGKTMTIVAVCGLAVNLCLMKILGHGHGGHGGGGHGHSHGGASTKPDYQSLDDEPEEHEERHSHGGEISIKTEGHAHDDGHDHGGHGHEDGDHGHSHGDGGHGGHDEEKGGHGHEENINVRAAYVHALGDLVQSVGVCIAGAMIWYNPKWQLADPCATILFSILVMWTTWGIIKSSVSVLMEGTPEAFDPNEICQNLRKIKNVTAVHDLHIWSLTMGKPSLSVHIEATDDTDIVLHKAQRLLGKKYGIDHATIQVERAGAANLSCEPCGGS